MLQGIVQTIDEWLGPIVFAIIAIIVVGGLVLIISLNNGPTQWCEPNTNRCITPAVPLYCHNYVCITAVPTLRGSQ